MAMGMGRRTRPAVLALLSSFLIMRLVPAAALFAALLAGPSAAEEPTAPAPGRIEQSLLLSYLADKTVFTLIDARSPEEFEASHVDGAINLPLDRVAAKSPGLPAALDEPIVVYCKSGKRATSVAQALSKLGYANVRVLPSEQLMFHDELVIFNCSESAKKDGSG